MYQYPPPGYYPPPQRPQNWWQRMPLWGKILLIIGALFVAYICGAFLVGFIIGLTGSAPH